MAVRGDSTATARKERRERRSALISGITEKALKTAANLSLFAVTEEIVMGSEEGADTDEILDGIKRYIEAYRRIGNVTELSPMSDEQFREPLKMLGIDFDEAEEAGKRITVGQKAIQAPKAQRGVSRRSKQPRDSGKGDDSDSYTWTEALRKISIAKYTLLAKKLSDDGDVDNLFYRSGAGKRIKIRDFPKIEEIAKDYLEEPEGRDKKEKTQSGGRGKEKDGEYVSKSYAIQCLSGPSRPYAQTRKLLDSIEEAGRYFVESHGGQKVLKDDIIKIRELLNEYESGGRKRHGGRGGRRSGKNKLPAGYVRIEEVLRVEGIDKEQGMKEVTGKPGRYEQWIEKSNSDLIIKKTNWEPFITKFSKWYSGSRKY